MKKLINRRPDVIPEMLEGLLALYPGLFRLGHYNVVLRSPVELARDRQVALISGGGSGHEPAHAGFVGPGMLHAAVLGEIFTSPSADSVLAAIRAVAGGLGVLLIVKNYTGDRLNFGLAAEMARSEGYLVETVVVADDMALAASHDHAGRRGLAGTVLVHKVAGAAAAAGLDLPQVASIAQAAANNLGTMGVALSAAITPDFEGPAFTLDGQIELGLGIHGEPGIRRIPAIPADELIDTLLHSILANLRLAAGDSVAVLLNNLGATTSLEMAIAARRVLTVLSARGLTVERLYGGTFLSALDMAGISLSLLRLDGDRLKWLDAPTAAPAWPNGPRHPPSAPSERVVAAFEAAEAPPSRQPQTDAGRKTARILLSACDALEQAENRLTELDQAVGDGDLGYNLTRAARAIREALPVLPLDYPAELLQQLGRRVQQVLGGSSGPLYGVLLLRTGSSLESSPDTPSVWAAALLDGCDALSELGGARLGDRTMLDALVPFARAFADQLAVGTTLPEALRRAVNAAQMGADRTAHIVARRGRSSYLGERSLGLPDPGAVAIAVLLSAVVEEVLR